MYALVLNDQVYKVINSGPMLPSMLSVDLGNNPQGVNETFSYSQGKFIAPPPLTPQQQILNKYPSTTQLVDFLHNSMVSGEIPKSNAFVNLMNNIKNPVNLG
jgi:hypothetical protein